MQPTLERGPPRNGNAARQAMTGKGRNQFPTAARLNNLIGGDEHSAYAVLVLGR